MAKNKGGSGHYPQADPYGGGTSKSNPFFPYEQQLKDPKTDSSKSINSPHGSIFDIPKHSGNAFDVLGSKRNVRNGD